MVRPTVVAALLAATPTVLAQSNSTASFTLCSTNFEVTPLPTDVTNVPTWITYVRSTQTIITTNTIQDTITTTLNATACGGLATETATVTSVSLITPPAITIPARAGQLPLLRFGTAGPSATPIPRIKRLQADPNAEVSPLHRRQTLPGNTAGFIVDENGTTSDLNRTYPHLVLCERRRTVVITSQVIESAAPTTVTVVPALSTTTVTTTVTETGTAPTPRVYEACGPNNVVNSIPFTNGSRVNFDRVLYDPLEGFPIANELIVNTTTPTNCCGACQEAPNCAGSFYVPSRSQCHLRLTAPPTPPSNATLALPAPPTGDGSLVIGTNVILPTGSASALPFPTINGTAVTPSLPTTTASPQPGTCPNGILTLYLGIIRGRLSTEFPDRFALYFSNGPCGRFSINPNPVGVTTLDK